MNNINLYNLWESELGSQKEPHIYIATPWNVPFISTNFCVTLRNLKIPFEHIYNAHLARHIADARNGICVEAVKKKATHIMMIDADQWIPQDAFIRLWRILEEYGHEDTIAFGWTILRTGRFTGKPGVFKIKNGELHSIEDIKSCRQPISVDAISTCCLLFNTQILRRIHPPWFADIYIIREEEKFADNPQRVIYAPTQFSTGQDVFFSVRAKSCGFKIICDPNLKLPHEIIGTI